MGSTSLLVFGSDFQNSGYRGGCAPDLSADCTAKAVHPPVKIAANNNRSRNHPASRYDNVGAAKIQRR